MADDDTLIADSKKKVEEIIQALITAGGEYGLNFNKSKTKIIQIRGKKELTKINEYDIEGDVQYLGIK